MASNNNCMNKVYINPNFKKTCVTADIPTNTIPPMNRNVMHVNPNFNNLKARMASKIFVNPNFIALHAPQSQLGIGDYKEQVKKHCTSSSAEKLSNFTQDNSNPSTSKENTYKAVPHNMKSRYSLIRQETNRRTSLTAHSSASVTCHTYKVNKYKIIPLTDVKKDLNKKTQLVQQYANWKNRFKFVQAKVEETGASQINQRAPAMKSINTKKIKMSVRKLKINNLPCPLFKKYGKCLRNTNGNCKYLHDRKHISLCRKFIKGICHDKDCTLSHDLSNKKMPTCYFYLRGRCTKDKCPYLHVKLNEKTKICSEFLKGYCEKGENCLNRHINICPHLADKGVCRDIQCTFNHKKVILKKNNVKKVIIPTENISLKRKSSLRVNKKENQSLETRYYRDVEINESLTKQTEFIRPSRCKLGSLPSFIEL